MRCPARLLVLSAAAVLLTAGLAAGHKERPMASPIRPGPVPDLNRVSDRTLIVCKPSSKPPCDFSKTGNGGSCRRGRKP